MAYIKYFLVSLFIFHSFSVLAKTGYVNMAVAIEKTSQGKRAKSKLQSKLAKAKKSMKSIEKNLSKERAKLEKQAPLLSEQSRAQKVQQFQQKVFQSQKQAEAKQLELKKYEEQIMKPIINKMTAIVSQVAAKNKFTVVRNIDANTVWVSPSVDLTKKVYKAFNKKHK